ncbi:hypothetical protein KP509_21G051900 [Ceratopteris richardii]|uniref:Uncharacterized protein n=1 Tax=Ceratopteris richardii TaxID=49495 RepID=A0A8T2S9X3_CERRI|nr:hypothetical protein KP509_21G051900 [Ceratopteris richardii]
MILRRHWTVVQAHKCWQFLQMSVFFTRVISYSIVPVYTFGLGRRAVVACSYGWYIWYETGTAIKLFLFPPKPLPRSHPKEPCISIRALLVPLTYVHMQLCKVVVL